MRATLADITLAVRDRLVGMSVRVPVEGGFTTTLVPVFVENSVPLPNPMPETHILIRPLTDLEPDLERRESIVEYFDEETQEVQPADEPHLLTVHIFTTTRWASVDHELSLGVSRKIRVWSVMEVGDEQFDTRRIGFIPVEKPQGDVAQFVRCFAFQVLISIAFPDEFFGVGVIEEIEVDVEPNS